MSWTIAECQGCLAKALKLAKGTYQEDLLKGFEALSGSTLKGKAGQYVGSYAKCRSALIKRLHDAGIQTG